MIDCKHVVRIAAIWTSVFAWGLAASAYEPQETQPPAPEADAADAPAATVEYPISVAVAPDGSAVVVDLNLPGLWRVPKEGGAAELIYRGTELLRKPMNRPRTAVVLDDGAILVGDTATREIYRIAPDGSGEPKPLTDGYLGIPNSLATDGQGRLFIADLESHFVYAVPVSGGKPELFSKTNARGLFYGPDGSLWAVTPGEQPLVKLGEDGEATPVVSERLFEFPHNVVVAEDGTAYVTDGYAKAIWKVPSGGTAEKFVEGAPLVNPVGLALRDGVLLVADPHAKQLFSVDINTKEIKPLIQ